MRYECDECSAILPDGYVPQVDHQSRPVAALCTGCNARNVRIQAARRRRNEKATADLIEAFEQMYPRGIPPMRPGH